MKIFLIIFICYKNLTKYAHKFNYNPYNLNIKNKCSLTTDSSTVTLLRLRLRYESITQKQYFKYLYRQI